MIVPALKRTHRPMESAAQYALVLAWPAAGIAVELGHDGEITEVSGTSEALSHTDDRIVKPGDYVVSKKANDWQLLRERLSLWPGDVDPRFAMPVRIVSAYRHFDHQIGVSRTGITNHYPPGSVVIRESTLPPDVLFREASRGKLSFPAGERILLDGEIAGLDAQFHASYPSYHMSGEEFHRQDGAVRLLKEAHVAPLWAPLRQQARLVRQHPDRDHALDLSLLRKHALQSPSLYPWVDLS